MHRENIGLSSECKLIVGTNMLAKGATLPNLLLISFALLSLISCRQPPVTSELIVGSKDFSEQLILGEIIAQVIERHAGVTVTRKFALGGTSSLDKALGSGQIDVYAEYSGTAIRDILNLEPESTTDDSWLKAARKEYSKRNVECMEPLGLNDAFVLAISEDDPRASQMTTLSDAVTDQIKGWRLGVGDEFESRPDGLVGMLKKYPLRINSQPRVYKLQDLYRALEEGEVDMIAGDSTDGLLPMSRVKVLKDDQKFFPQYQAFILVRSNAIQKYPKLRGSLALLSGKISNEAIQEMNYEVDGLHMSVKDVSNKFLRSIGL